MLPKKHTDLRTIVLIDSESNHTYKCIGIEAIIAAIYHEQIYPEQCSRTQCSAVADGINRRLVVYYQQYLWQPFSLKCSDFKGCYDIIIQSAASLALQRLGIPLTKIINMLDTIQRMSHTVSTAYVDSNLSYGGYHTRICHSLHYVTLSRKR